MTICWGDDMRIKYTALHQMEQDKQRSAIQPYAGADVIITNRNSCFFGQKGLVFQMEDKLNGCWIAFNSDYRRQAFFYFDDMEVL